MVKDTIKRSLIKSLVWRIFAAFVTFVTLLLSSLFTGPLVAVAAVAAIVDGLVKFISHYFHERIWSTISYGQEVIEKPGVTLFLTGLPCSGKTTIALELKEYFEKQLQRVEYLDGDVIRTLKNWNLGFSPKDRKENIQRIGRISGLLSKRAITICSFVSPYEEDRNFVRDCNDQFILIHVACPLDECITRDVKGMYAKALNGEIKGFTGIDAPYEVPKDPNIVVNTAQQTVKQSVKIIIDYLKANKAV